MKCVIRAMILVAGAGLAAASLAQEDTVQSDYVILFSSDSVGDLAVDGLNPVQLGLQGGSNALLSLDDPACPTSGCQGDLNYLRITLNDFEVEMTVSIDGTPMPALILLDDPTVIVRSVPITHGATDFVVPVGTSTSFNATLSGTVDLGSGPEPIPEQLAISSSPLVAPLFIDIDPVAQIFVFDGTAPFSFDASGMIEDADFVLDLSGDIAFLADGRTPFFNGPPDATSAEVTLGPGGSVTLDASAAVDPQNNIVSFAWFLEDGTLLADTASATATLLVGPHTVILIVTDQLGAQARVEFQVEVEDTTPPVITFVPPDLTISSCTNPHLGLAMATDDSGAPVTITNDAPVTFPLGQTTVTWTATDSSGNTAQATQIVTAILGDDPSCCPLGTHVLLGTSGSNNLVGTSGSDCILGRGGADQINGFGGNDFVSGGAGNDTIAAHGGNDYIVGGGGDDTVDAGPGNDFVDGNDGIDTCSGGGGTDALSCEVASFCTAPCCATQSCGGSPPDDSECGAAFVQSDCSNYIQGSVVSLHGRNWGCSSGNCANCATHASCAPGASGCPWGVVWMDLGPCH